MQQVTVKLEVTVLVHMDEEGDLASVIQDATREMQKVRYEGGGDIVDVMLNDFNVEDSR
jgi:hypothetical protein